PVLLAAQLLVALPLGWILARELARAAARIGVLAWAMIGLMLLATTAAIGPVIAAGLDQVAAGFLARALLRSALAVVIVVPWLVPRAGGRGPSRGQSPSPPALVIAAILAMLPPMAFAYRLTEIRSADVATDLDTGRLAKARGMLEVLCELGSWKNVADVPARALLRSVRVDLDRHHKAASTPPPHPPTPPQLLHPALPLP